LVQSLYFVFPPERVGSVMEIGDGVCYIAVVQNLKSKSQ
jgi:hypothetical protein